MIVHIVWSLSTRERASFPMRLNSLFKRSINKAALTGRIGSFHEPARFSVTSPGLERGGPGYG